ncbi:MAG: N-acetyltransferase family protein [Hylemonella sp.]|nr:N-acetyltransferase family protein [Hylemonella sp.]MDP1938255.1 N-acetyltransferase family protein [Hylemonella sp.]
MPIIRPSRDEDIAAIASIYTHHVMHGTGTFELDPPSPADMQARRAEVQARGLPWLVAEDRGQVLGYAYCNWFRPRPAYRYAAEDSIYLAPQACGQGLGRALLTELSAAAERAGMRKLIAVIGDSANVASIGLHRSCGFTPAGVLTSSGWKFDRWLDTVLMEKPLGPGDRTAPAHP